MNEGSLSLEVYARVANAGDSLDCLANVARAVVAAHALHGESSNGHFVADLVGNVLIMCQNLSRHTRSHNLASYGTLSIANQNH